MESQTPPNLLPIHIDEGATEFTIDGQLFIVESEARLSVARHRQLERFSSYALLGRNAVQLITEARGAYDSINAGKPADAAVKLHNFMKAVSDIEQRPNPFLYICTLFINKPDEDRAAFDMTQADAKVLAFQRCEMDFFFRQAIGWLNGSGDYSKLITQLFSANNPLNQTLD